MRFVLLALLAFATLAGCDAVYTGGPTNIGGDGTPWFHDYCPRGTCESLARARCHGSYVKTEDSNEHDMIYACKDD